MTRVSNFTVADPLVFLDSVNVVRGDFWPGLRTRCRAGTIPEFMDLHWCHVF